MRRSTKIEILFGLFALALIYLVIANDASITGFVTGASTGITLVAPTDNTQTKATSIYFMFEYSPELEMKECSLVLDDYVARTATGLLSPYDTRIRKDLEPGTYLWRIECVDSNDQTFTSGNRHLVIEEEEEPELKITSFPNRDGVIYEFELKQDLELDINEVVPNDMLRAKKEGNTYEMNVLRIIQDYSINLEFVEFMITPGDKRIKVYKGASVSVDFNNDGQDDLNIMLNKVSYRKAFFTLSTKQEPEKDEEAKPPVVEKPSVVTTPAQEKQEEVKAEIKAEEQQPAQKPEKAEGSLIGIFIIGLIIVLIIAILSAVKSRREDEKHYLTKLKKDAMKLKKKRKKKPRRKSKKKVKKKIVKKKIVKKKLKKKKAKKKTKRKKK